MIKRVFLILLFFLCLVNIFSNPLKEKYKKIKNATVYIVVERENFYEEIAIIKPHYYKKKITKGSGSGFFISPDGEILTVYHVVEASEKITVYDNGIKYDAKLIGYDTFTDIALLKIDVKDHEYLDLSNKDSISVNDQIWCVGNSLGIGLIITSGIINSSKPVFCGIHFYERFIRLDAPLNPGMSGGPILNSNCEVIGINDAKINKFKQGKTEKTNFGISAAVFNRVYNSIKRNNGNPERYILGISIDTDNEKNRKRFDYLQEKGIIVTGIFEDFPAAQAGILPGDVIIAINDHRITDPAILQDFLFFSETPIEYKILLNRKGNTFEIKLKTKKIDQGFKLPPLFIFSNYAGLYVDKENFVISGVQPNSVAEKAKIPIGKKIKYLVTGRHFNDLFATKIRNYDDLKKAFDDSILTHQIAFAFVWGINLSNSRVLIFHKIYPIII